MIILAITMCGRAETTHSQKARTCGAPWVEAEAGIDFQTRQSEQPGLITVTIKVADTCADCAAARQCPFVTILL